MKKYDLVIFDMDGTILDTLDDLCDATNYTLAQMGCPKRSKEEVRCFVGNGILKLLERAMPSGTTKAQIRQAFSIFMEYYNKHCMDKTKPYDGIIDLLRELRAQGIKTAVVSNKRHETVKILCDDLFTGLFDAFEGDRPGVPKKPDSAMVDLVLEKLNIQRENAVYVGDSDVDLTTAVNSGMDYIIVTWGFRNEVFLREKGADIFAHTTEELLEYIIVAA